MHVTIGDENTRCALKSALWECAQNAIGEGFWDDLWSCSWQTVEDQEDDLVAELSGKMDRLMGIRQAIEQVGRAEIGRAVELPVAPEALHKGLESCKYHCEHVDGFWERSADQRDRIGAVRDASVAMLGEFEPAKAVA
jgi:hypothetical protein